MGLGYVAGNRMILLQVARVPILAAFTHSFTHLLLVFGVVGLPLSTGDIMENKACGSCSQGP